MDSFDINISVDARKDAFDPPPHSPRTKPTPDSNLSDCRTRKVLLETLVA